MWPYIALFAFFAVGALLTVRRAIAPQLAGQAMDPLSFRTSAGPLFAIGLIVVGVLIGLRYEVGADYDTYVELFRRSRLLSFNSLIELGDWGYYLTSQVLSENGGSLWQLNSLCAVLFCWGLYRLARTQPEPWLVLVVAIPYMITVVAMGYTRQATALGILMMGLAAVLRGAGLFRFALYVAVAAMFHRSAVIVLPLMMFVLPRSRATDVLLLAALTLSLYVLFLQDAVEQFQRGYLKSGYQSQGAAIRIAQLALAALLYFAARARLGFSEIEGRLWRNYSLVALAMALVLAISPSSTAVDRVSLYLLPLQLAIIARLPLALTNPVLARLLVVTYSGLVLFVWLNYAAHARFWLPYQTIFAAEGGS